MAYLQDLNTSLTDNSSNTTTRDTVDWIVNASNISSTLSPPTPPVIVHSNAITQLSIIVKCAILIPVACVGIVGNALTLTAIRTTPRLWTKTNVFLASLSVADVLVALTLGYYVAYQLLVYIFVNPCLFARMIAVITPIQSFPLYVSVSHIGLLAADRYAAIVHPFHYERLVTGTVVAVTIGTVWTVPTLMSVLQMFWLLRVDWNSCAAPYSITIQFALTASIYGTVAVIMVAAYTRILRVVLLHRAMINTMAVIATQQGAVAEQPRLSVHGPAVAAPATAIDHAKGPGLRNVSKKSEFKAARMVAVMLASFVVLWFPNILGKGFQAAGRHDSYTQYLIDVGVGLGSANNSISWVIYGIMSRDFRVAVKRLFGKRETYG